MKHNTKHHTNNSRNITPNTASLRESDSGAVIIFEDILPRCKLTIGWNTSRGPLRLDLGIHLATLNLAARKTNLQLAQLCVKSMNQCGYDRGQDYYDALYQVECGLI